MTSNPNVIQLKVLALNYRKKVNWLTKLLTGDKSEYHLILAKQDDASQRIAMGIGEFEGQAIAIALEGMTPSRPLTHDVFKSATDKFGFHLDNTIITHVDKNGFYYSLLNYTDGQKRVEVDSRPADAIALALRHNSPIYIDKTTFDKFVTVGTD